ncbi:Uncharacterised protein [Escherichia coli]|nr:Uncharacterised protein [Escherichia coli]
MWHFILLLQREYSGCQYFPELYQELFFLS